MSNEQKSMLHISVLKNEAIQYLDVKSGSWYIDGTLGAGGHTQAILDEGGNAIGIDRDKKAILNAEEIFAEEIEIGRVKVFHQEFAQIRKVVEECDLLGNVEGVLFDFGLSSDQLADETRGFSFQKGGKLDMRMNEQSQVQAADLLNVLTQKELVQIFRSYGEAPYATQVARAIIEYREQLPFEKVDEFTSLVEKVVPSSWWKKKRIHPATLFFQALRIAVNGELDQIEDALKGSVETLSAGGRVVTISFHSLEDRIVKQFFRDEPQLTVITKKPIQPTTEEINSNSRASSAKMRVAVKK